MIRGLANGEQFAILETTEDVAGRLRATGAAAVLGDHLASAGAGLNARIAVVVAQLAIEATGDRVRIEVDPEIVARWLDRTTHDQDEHCVLGDDDLCLICGTYHGDPCTECGGCGFHRRTAPGRSPCSWSDEVANVATASEREEALGAVLAQVEDLPFDARASVLSEALAAQAASSPAGPILCKHCNRPIVEAKAGLWIDAEICEPDCTVYERDPYGDSAHEPNLREHPVARLLWIVDRILDQHGGLLDERTWDRLDAAVGRVREDAAPPPASGTAPRRVTRTVVVEMEIEADHCDDPAAIVGRVLDVGDFQDAISDHPDASLTVVSAVVKGS